MISFMKKTLLFFILLCSTRICAQYGYYYNEKFIQLTLDTIAPFLVEVNNENDIFNTNRSGSLQDTMVTKVSESLFFVRDSNIIKDNVYKSERFVDSKGNSTYILPRIILSVQSKDILDSILKSYENELSFYSLLLRNDVFMLACKQNNAKEVLNLVNKIGGLNGVNWCEPDMLCPIKNHNVYYPQQYYLHNSVSGQYDINVEPAWKLQNGISDIVVAIIDSGVESDHPDLSGRVMQGYTVGNTSGYGYPQNVNVFDSKAHGTACAGIVGANDDSLGIKGVTSNVRILPVNIIPYYASGFFYNTIPITTNEGFAVSSDIGIAIQWAADRADVLSCSWKCGESNYINSAIQYARTDGRSGKGCVVAFSSGNDFTTETDVSFPANVNGVLTVGAVYRDGMITSYSQRGTSMDLVAFGGDNDIVTTDRMGDLGYNPNPDSAITDLSDTNCTKFFGGTSAACPQVAGVAALI